MGLALPLFGYALPKGQRTVVHDPESAWNRQARDGILDFGRTLRDLMPSLREFIYSQPDPTWPSDLVVELVIETDEVERPGLRRLLREIKGKAPGSIVVPNLDHLLLSRSDFQSTEHRVLLAEIVSSLVPVFTTQLGRGRTLVGDIAQNKSNAYFAMADNYAGNRNTLEKHLAQFPLHTAL